MLIAMRPAGSSASTMLTVAKRSLGSAAQFTVTSDIQKQVVNELPEDKLTIRDVQKLDGEYVLLVTPPRPVGNRMYATICFQHALFSNRVLAVPMNDQEARGY
jgi:hypothetical protein